MKPRLLRSIELAALLVGLPVACAAQFPPTHLEIKEALEAASQDLPRGIAIIEKALSHDPDNREAIYLLGAMTVNHGEQVEDKAERIAAFHKATAAFARLRQLYKEPNRPEQKMYLRSRIGEARALALEGRTAESAALLKEILASGSDDLEAIEAEKDFEAVRARPEVRELLATTYRAQVAELKPLVVEEMTHQRSYPFDFELKDTDEKTVSLADYDGKVTIVDLWGTWCAPCRQEVPHLVEIYKTYKTQGLEVVGINCNEEGNREEKKKTVKDFAAKNGIGYECLLNDEKTEEKIPGFEAYPTKVFLDRSGKVRLTLPGSLSRAKLEAIVTTLLAEGKS